MNNRANVETVTVELERARELYPALYQHVLDRVKPEGDHNNRTSRRINWWIFGEPVGKLRVALSGLRRYIATVETSKFKTFIFMDKMVLPDHKLNAIAVDDAALLGLLSSRIHQTWALAAGGRLGVGNDPTWTNSTCFMPFPFPSVARDQRSRIRTLSEQLDAHRKARQTEYPTLTLTGMYNVLAKLRSGEPLTDKERAIHEQGLVSVLKQIHDDLDAAVFDAYGWPHDLTDDEILTRLVALNRERAAEEARGIVRWLRPEFQNPEGAKAARQTAMLIEPEAEPAPAGPAAPAKKQPWPKTLAEQAQAVRSALASAPAGLTAEQLARTLVRGQTKRVEELLETLVSLGQARALRNGRYIRV